MILFTVIYGVGEMIVVPVILCIVLIQIKISGCQDLELEDASQEQEMVILHVSLANICIYLVVMKRKLIDFHKTFTF